MSAHTECARVGKFDCHYDQYVHSASLEEGLGEGDVQAPCAWFAEFTLDPAAEPGFAEHYGGRWLVLRELEDGRFFVEVYETSEARDERLEALRTAYEDWDISTLSGTI